MGLSRVARRANVNYGKRLSFIMQALFTILLREFGMRRLLTWITTLTACLTIPILGVRVLRGAAVPESCVQLLDPARGAVLTIDMHTGEALPDSRTVFPLSLKRGDLMDISPDQRYVANIAYLDATTRQLWISKRNYDKQWVFSSTMLHYQWSPDSRYISFIERHERSSSLASAEFVVAELSSRRVFRESLTDASSLATQWNSDEYQPLWSPDSRLIAVLMALSATGDSSLLLHSVERDQSMYVKFSDEQIMGISWTPDSQLLMVFTMDGENHYILYRITRAGEVVSRIILPFNFQPILYGDLLSTKGVIWSPDQQYFFLISHNPMQDETLNDWQVDIFTAAGERILNEPIITTRVWWSAQFHTLTYFVDSLISPRVLALDVATDTTTPLIELVYPHRVVSFAPDGSQWAVFGRINEDAAPTVHVFSSDLLQHTTPFGDVQMNSVATIWWSADARQLVAYENDKSDGKQVFTVQWVRNIGNHNDAVGYFTMDTTGTHIGDIHALWKDANTLLLMALVARSKQSNNAEYPETPNSM
jgi:hypothetical protein